LLHPSRTMGEGKTLPTYLCRNCENPLALGEDLISKKFVGASGPAFMFSHAMNVVIGPKIERKLITGSYMVADVMCGNCGENMWRPSILNRGENLIDLFGKVDHALKVFDRMAQSVGPRLYSCCNCRNHVGLHDDIISKAFQGRTGRAFLFSHAMNIVVGPKEDRNLLTGLHTVADISCADCNEPLGWKYERAYESSQKYKEGKFIFEKAKIVKEEDW
ncbi:hypothetical protein HID58_042018, partial [Brassica napus]